MHRIREAMDFAHEEFVGEVEVAETYIGGKEGNKHKSKSKRLRAGRGTVGKQAVVGVKDRGSKLVKPQAVDDTTSKTLYRFINDSVAPNSQVYIDEAKAYTGLVDFDHESVAHSIGKYVKDQAHTNGIEALWSMLKRGYVGEYRKMSFKHLHLFVEMFAGRHNIRPMNTLVQMVLVANNMTVTRLRYKDLVRDETDEFELAELVLD